MVEVLKAGLTTNWAPREDAGPRRLGIEDGARTHHRVLAQAARDLLDQADGAGDGHRDLEDVDSALTDGVDGPKRLVGRFGPHHGHDAHVLDPREDGGFAHRCTRAVPPFMTRSTSARLTIVVSPGVVMARAP